MKLTKKRKWIIVVATVVLVLIVSIALFAVNRNKSSSFRQSVEEARGLPQDQCICWSGVGNSGHCIASEACE